MPVLIEWNGRLQPVMLAPQCSFIFFAVFFEGRRRSYISGAREEQQRKREKMGADQVCDVRGVWGRGGWRGGLKRAERVLSMCSVSMIWCWTRKYASARIDREMLANWLYMCRFPVCRIQRDKLQQHTQTICSFEPTCAAQRDETTRRWLFGKINSINLYYIYANIFNSIDTSIHM